MKKSKIEQLETLKQSLISKISNLGNMRKGTIAIQYQKCGKKSCSCHSKDGKGHGPYPLYSTKIKGKSKAIYISGKSQLKKFEEEIENYKKYKLWTNKLIEINEKLCDLTPVEETDDTVAADFKKNLKLRFILKCKRK